MFILQKITGVSHNAKIPTFNNERKMFYPVQVTQQRSQGGNSNGFGASEKHNIP
jgi:hypothetical protein